MSEREIFAYTESEKPKESIFERTEIKAPANYVPAYHLTIPEFLPNINENGLRAEAVSRYRAGSEYYNRKRIVNKLFDDYRPAEIKERGLSRFNIYAFHDLAAGRWFSERLPSSRESLELNYQFLKEEYPEKLGGKTLEQYISENNDINVLKQRSEDQILELRINPETAWVFDVSIYESSEVGAKPDKPLSETKIKRIQKYWKSGVPLKVFLEDYEDHDGWYTRKKSADKNLPEGFSEPEILIPENIPQEHIKVIE